MHPYLDVPAAGRWKAASRKWQRRSFEGLYSPKWRLSKETPIATAGSCFAQHIGRNLRNHAFNYLDFEPAPSGMSKERRQAFGYDLFSARYGNVYTTRQLLTILQAAFGERTTEIWEVDGRYFDAVRPTVEPNGFGSLEEARALQQSHYAAVRRMVESAEVFVFTLGLTEAWINAETGAGYQICPGTTAGSFDPDLHRFKNLTYTDVAGDLEAIFALWRSVNSDTKFIFTVSPVPLAATAAGGHVVASTIYSKSVLRAVAGDLSDRLDYVDYFPSFEIITCHLGSAQSFEDDGRNVRDSAVSDVMQCFFAAHGVDIGGDAAGGADVAREEAIVRRRNAVSKEMQVLCDEAQLDVESVR